MNIVFGYIFWMIGTRLNMGDSYYAVIVLSVILHELLGCMRSAERRRNAERQDGQNHAGQ